MNGAASAAKRHSERGRIPDKQACYPWISGEREQIIISCNEKLCRTGERCHQDDLVVLIANPYGTGKAGLDDDRITPEPALQGQNGIRRHSVSA